MQRLRYSRYFKTAVILMDLFIVSAVFVFFFLQREGHLVSQFYQEQELLSLLLLGLFWILLSARTKLYTIPRNLTYTLYVERIITHIFLFLLGLILLAKVSNNEFLKYERFWIAFTLFSILFIVKSGLFFSLKYFRKKGGNYRNIMFLAENPSTEILKNIVVQRKDYGYKLFDFSLADNDIKALRTFWKEKGIHTVFMPTDSELDPEVEIQLFKIASLDRVKICLVPSLVHNEFFEYDLGYLETQPILAPSKFPLQYYSNRTLKRIFDLVFSVLFLLFIATWLFPLIAILIKIDSKGSVFFLQKRYGFHDQIFNCIKFRTMIENEDSSTKTTAQNDKRITRIGKFLRRNSLDEMPQFINVLLGDMSVVGPRPHMLLIDDYYKTKIGRYAIRSRVKPGITGLAQVSGLRGDNGNIELEMKKRILADSFYVKNWSLVLDAVIIFKTIFLLIKGDKKAL